MRTSGARASKIVVDPDRNDLRLVEVLVDRVETVALDLVPNAELVEEIGDRENESALSFKTGFLNPRSTEERAASTP